MNEEILIGMSKEDAIEYCKDNNLRYRIVREDSNNYIVTCDFVVNRFNLRIDNGIVTSCDLG